MTPERMVQIATAITECEIAADLARRAQAVHAAAERRLRSLWNVTATEAAAAQAPQLVQTPPAPAPTE